MKILFSGGGTLGPVTPLLAVREIVRTAYPDAAFVWVGTNRGPERVLVEQTGMKFYAIAGGKLRRYASFDNMIDLFRVAAGFFQACKIVWQENPDAVVSAGGFVSVPVHVAAWVLGVPAWVHEQDVEAGLATKLMAPLAAVITTALEKNTNRFPAKKTRWLGNPIRSELFSGDKKRAREWFSLDPNLPVVFATGGGTGSAKVNAMVAEAVPHLQHVAQVIHVTGRERSNDIAMRAAKLFPSYHVYRFFVGEMKDAYAAADIVVSRGGFGTLSEIAALGKAAVLIPKPGHQDKNAAFLAAAQAALFLDERTATGYHLAAEIKELLRNREMKRSMEQRLRSLLPPARREDILTIIRTLIP